MRGNDPSIDPPWQRALFWPNATASVMEIGDATFPGSASRAYAVRETAQVDPQFVVGRVGDQTNGEAAIWWQETAGSSWIGILGSSLSVKPAPGSTLPVTAHLQEFRDVNYSGWIAGAARDATSHAQAVLLVPSPIPADIDGNLTVDSSDLSLLLTAFGPCNTFPCDADIDGDGFVGAADLALLLFQFGRVEIDLSGLCAQLNCGRLNSAESGSESPSPVVAEAVVRFGFDCPFAYCEWLGTLSIEAQASVLYVLERDIASQTSENENSNGQ
jgi:hypothetical protein